MGGRGKRKSGGGGEGPTKSRKRKTPSVAIPIPTRNEESPPNPDIDEPQVKDIIKVELDSESDLSGLNSNQQEMFDDPNFNNQDLASNPDIDIGEVEVKVLQYPEDQFIEEAEDSNMSSEPVTPNIDHDIGVTIDGAPSTTNQPDRVLSSLPMQAKDGEIPKPKVSGELQVATCQNELLQQKVDSDSSHIQGLSRKITLLEDEVRNFRAECEVLKEELEEARTENETLQRKLHTKRVDLARQTSRAQMLEEEQRKIVQENSGTVRRLDDELNRKTNLPDGGQDDNADLRRLITEKDEVIQKRTGDIEGLQRDLKVLEDALKGRLAELDVAKKVADENSGIIKKQQKESNRKIVLLKNSISEKDKELALFKARYLKDDQGNSQLHLAAKEGNEKSVKELIQSGADVHARNNNCETPIFLAAASESDTNAALRIVKYLVEHGVAVLTKDSEGQTFLHKFASNKNAPTSFQLHDISDYLVSKSLTSLFNIRDRDNGSTPLMLAARNVELDKATTSLLKTNGVDFNLVDNQGRSYISYAAEGRKNMNLLKQLIGIGSIKHKNLAQAIADEDVDSVHALVGLGADVNKTNKDLETPLHLTTKSSNTQFSINIIKLLINSGAKADAKDMYGGHLFLHRLIDRNWIIESKGPISPAQFHELVSFLISKDLSRLVNTPRYEGSTPFLLKLKIGEIETATLSLLRDNGFDFNAVPKKGDYFGVSILYHAIANGRTLRMISDLVAFGANPNHLSNNKKTMFHVAAGSGRLDIVKFCLDQGLDINRQDDEGETPLHYGIKNEKSSFKMVQCLLRNGANPSIVNKSGKTACDYFNKWRDSYPNPDQISTLFSLGSSC